MNRNRLLLGPVLIIAVVLGVWLDNWIDGRVAPEWWPGEDPTLPPGTVVLPVVAALAALGGRELARILRDKGIVASRSLTATVAAVGVTIVALMPSGVDGLTGLAVVGSAAGLVLVSSLLIYVRRKKVEGMTSAAGGALLSFIYLGMLLGFLVAIRRDHSGWVLLWILLTIKSCDIGAYFTGVSIGRHKLIPWLSPGKTWEGLIGGVVTAGAVGAGGLVLLEQQPVWPGLAVGFGLGMVLGLVGQLGDLLASLLKRDAGLKDTGASLPGFGGVIDVIDSPVLAAPVAFWLLRIIV